MLRLPKVTETATGDVLNFTAYKKHVRDELAQYSMTKQEVLNTKLVKSKDFAAFCENNQITPIVYKNRTYVNRAATLAALNKSK